MSNSDEKSSLQSAIDEPINIDPYDPEWPQRFKTEKARLLKIFSSSFVEIEHIGSTAVPGLGAKPIIDMLAGIRSIHEADKLLGPLRQYGYDTPPNCNDGLTDRRWLMRHSDGHRTHHLHIVVHGSISWNRTIQFRDALIQNPAIAKKYEKLKRDLVTITNNDRSAYIMAKTEFVEMIVGE